MLATITIALLTAPRVLALAIVRQHYIHAQLSVTDPGIASTRIVIFQEIELAYSLCSAAIISIRPLLKDFNTGFGTAGEAITNFVSSAKAGYGYSSKITGNASNNSAMRSANRDKRNLIEGKDSEEYILQEHAERTPQKIYKQTSYTVRTEPTTNGIEPATSEEGSLRKPGVASLIGHAV